MEAFCGVPYHQYIHTRVYQASKECVYPSNLKLYAPNLMPFDVFSIFQHARPSVTRLYLPVGLLFVDGYHKHKLPKVFVRCCPKYILFNPLYIIILIYYIIPITTLCCDELFIKLCSQQCLAIFGDPFTWKHFHYFHQRVRIWHIANGTGFCWWVLEPSAVAFWRKYAVRH